MSRKSRDKGKRGELEWRDVLRRCGYPSAIRGVQHAGGADSPDVRCAALDGHVHFEVKRVEAFSIWKSWAQATEDAGDAMPVVATRRNRSDWLCVLRAEDLLWLLQKAWPGGGTDEA